MQVTVTLGKKCHLKSIKLKKYLDLFLLTTKSTFCGRNLDLPEIKKIKNCFFH